MPELRTGMALRYQRDIYIVVSFQHIHMGRGGASTRTKLKNARTGQVKEISVRDSDDIEEIRLERRAATYTYGSGDEYHFMDSESYEDVVFRREQISEELSYLKEGMEITVLDAEGEIIGMELPNFVELEVVETDPGLKGDTASGGTKPAKLETGKVIQVPLFIQVGENLRVDTRSDKYIERVK
jgi:elongation factor P